MNTYLGIFFITVLLYIFYIYSMEGFRDRRNFHHRSRQNVFYNPARYSNWYYPNYWEYATPIVTEVVREKPRTPDYTPFVTAVMGASFVALLYLAINK